MAYSRILTIQDISCVGQCSMTVALPILSACGHETCILPTAVLSTHTGGFGKPEVVHLSDHLQAMLEHWKRNQITFDCILVGYLGSEQAVDLADAIMKDMLSPGGISIVDPAMADHGKLYSGLNEGYVRKMEMLCRNADLILPNVTEAAMFTHTAYRDDPDESYIAQILSKLDHKCVVMTGVGYEEGKTGVIICQDGNIRHYVHDKIDRSFHGTGDMFAACFAGALMQGNSIWRAVEIASAFVYHSICNTVAEPVHWYGVKFETAIPQLIQMLNSEKTTE